MQFSFSASITPKFDSQQLYDELINKNWNKIQTTIIGLGEYILQYLQTYINTRSHRDGKTGNLANAMTLTKDLSPTTVGWGIGKIVDLNRNAPYWRMINYGGLTWVAKTGRGVPGYFGTGDAPDSAQRGSGVGTQRFHYDKGGSSFMMFPKNPIYPQNYIETTWLQMNREFQKLLNKLKTSK